ncbi:hypothetical protein TNCV_105451 [Trichonephila clavipes]|nr:hypothetical protein TNCV_105451 [Trichonephila clavipes]
MTFQRPSSFAWESIQNWTLRRLCSKTSQPLTSFYPADREMIGAVPTPIYGFKVHRARDDKDQWPDSNPGYAQTEMILPHGTLLWA